MITLYVTSTTPYAGKSALVVGLAKRFKKDGYACGYMRPLTTTKTRIGECVVDEEANSMCQTLGLTNDVESIWPICLDPITVESVLRGEEQDYERQVKDSFHRLSRGKDIMLLEGGSRCSQGALIGLSCDRIAQAIDAKVLTVAKHDVPSVLVVDDLLADKRLLGDRMIGAVLNAVDRNKLDYAENILAPFLQNHGIPVYAVLPHDRIFASVSVAELAEALHGEIIIRPDLGGTLVENYLVGAMSVDSALTFMRRKLNTALITGGDRSDILLAALETSTRCLILTGNLQPSAFILTRAEEASVPIILCKHDTMTTVQLAEQAMSQTRFHQEKKITRFEHMLEENFQFDRLYAELGLKHKA